MFVFVRYGDGEAVGDVVNASLNGILVKTANSIPRDADVDVHIQLGGTSAVKSIKFRGKITRRASNVAAIHIQAIDMDSFVVWREMVNRFEQQALQENDIPHREAS